MAGKEEGEVPPPEGGEAAAQESDAPLDIMGLFGMSAPAPAEVTDDRNTGGAQAIQDEVDEDPSSVPRVSETEDAEPEPSKDEGKEKVEDEEEEFVSAAEAVPGGGKEEVEDGGDKDKKQSKEADEDTPEQIAESILEMIIQSTEQLSHSVSLDSLVLSELRETEEEAQKLAQGLAEKKEEILKLKEKGNLTMADVDEIKAKQLEIKEMVEQFEELTTKMKELLEKSLRPSAAVKPDIGPCPKCGKAECVCQMPPNENLPPPICTCEDDVCTCEEPKSYTPGGWYDQQVADLFPQPKEVPICICGSKSHVCLCTFSDKDKECVCKKEDLKEFNIIADIMPKVVVCAPDVSLPRIIVCEPYTPLKQKPRKTHVCAPNRACKLDRY